MTHRDVANVLPSVADLYFELTQASSAVVDKVWLGHMTSDFCELGMRRMMAFRDGGNEQRFFDLSFAPLQKDPFPSLARLYEFLGEELTPRARARMEAWRRETPRNEHGGHHCDPAEFGLDPAQVRERFAFYSQRFKDVLMS
jgi:Sulfotransferase family